MVRAGLLQLSASDDPTANLPITQRLIDQAAGGGAEIIITPEVTNIVSISREHQQSVLSIESEDITLAALRSQAAKLGIWLLIGSLGLKTGDADGRFANRSFLITPDGEVAARYDKIHMFDVSVTKAETFRESEAYRPGKTAILVKTNLATIGMTICYDLRFPYLFRDLAKAGAYIITVPAAFTPVTGAAHWHTLLCARAIETGCFILAPAQTGEHVSTRNKTRSTYGHSLAVSPWGKILADGGTEPGVTFVDLDLDQVGAARARIPALMHDRAYSKPRVISLSSPEHA